MLVKVLRQLSFLTGILNNCKIHMFSIIDQDADKPEKLVTVANKKSENDIWGRQVGKRH